MYKQDKTGLRQLTGQIQVLLLILLLLCININQYSRFLRLFIFLSPICHNLDWSTQRMLLAWELKVLSLKVWLNNENFGFRQSRVPILFVCLFSCDFEQTFFIFFFIDFDGYYILLELTRVNPDRNMFK